MFKSGLYSPTPTSRDPDIEERLRKIQDKRREREEDPEIFAACGNLQLIVDKCKAEAEKWVHLQTEEKDRQKAERKEKEKEEERAREEENRKEAEREAEEEKERVLKAAKTAEEEMRRAERRQELLRKLAEDEKRRKDREEISSPQVPPIQMSSLQPQKLQIPSIQMLHYIRQENTIFFSRNAT